VQKLQRRFLDDDEEEDDDIDNGNDDDDDDGDDAEHGAAAARDKKIRASAKQGERPLVKEREPKASTHAFKLRRSKPSEQSEDSRSAGRAIESTCRSVNLDALASEEEEGEEEEGEEEAGGAMDSGGESEMDDFLEFDEGGWVGLRGESKLDPSLSHLVSVLADDAAIVRACRQRLVCRPFVFCLALEVLT
jgi:hypothetical protein